MIGRADIEGSKSNVAMNAWLPQASYLMFLSFFSDGAIFLAVQNNENYMFQNSFH